MVGGPGIPWQLWQCDGFFCLQIVTSVPRHMASTINQRDEVDVAIDIRPEIQILIRIFRAAALHVVEGIVPRGPVLCELIEVVQLAAQCIGAALQIALRLGTLQLAVRGLDKFLLDQQIDQRVPDYGGEQD